MVKSCQAAVNHHDTVPLLYTSCSPTGSLGKDYSVRQKLTRINVGELELHILYPFCDKANNFTPSYRKQALAGVDL